MTTCPLLWSFRLYPQFTSECTWLPGTQGKSGLYLDLKAPPTRGDPLACMPRLLPSPRLVLVQTPPPAVSFYRVKPPVSGSGTAERRNMPQLTWHATAVAPPKLLLGEEKLTL